jgi:hypothetical protein
MMARAAAGLALRKEKERLETTVRLRGSVGMLIEGRP